MKRSVAVLLFCTLPAHATTADRAAIAAAAASQAGVTRHYDPSYTAIRYPGGDVPLERGVCADVVVRAFRAIGVDLQVAVHEDMKRDFRAYPRLWNLRSPDANIDHRRVRNLMKFFERKGKTIPIGAAYAPGDVVAWKLPGGLDHIGVVAATRNTANTDYLVVHNIGNGTQIEDVLRAFRITGHYRW